MGVNKNHANKIIRHLLMIAKYKVVFFGGMKLQFKTYGTYITQPAHCIRESVKKNSFEKYVEFYNSL